jgi:hypothetical protein
MNISDTTSGPTTNCSCARLRAIENVLKDRELELLQLKGPCSNKACPLHYAHSGPCA